MEIAKSFVVKTSRDEAWRFLTDPSRVVRCLPGAALTGQVDERTYGGTITVKVGPVTAAYKGTLRFERLDTATWTADLVASGQDVRGKGGADMRMTSRLLERGPGETEVAITSQVNIVGVLAQFGRGMIQDVSDQLFQKFVEAARAELEAGGGAPASGSSGQARAGAQPVQALSLGAVAFRRAAGRAARQPAVWVGALIVVVLLLWLSRR